ncbi:hypothetical protein J6590_086476 [Homalodisca vitripennis]|nr:hypothetical protein J6590_086476 [Homalodisca vitripennis]
MKHLNANNSAIALQKSSNMQDNSTKQKKNKRACPHGRGRSDPSTARRVFLIKLLELHRDVRSRAMFSCTCYIVYVFEMKMRKLPHAHIVLKSDGKGPLQADDIDLVIRAEIASEEAGGRLRKLLFNEGEYREASRVHGPFKVPVLLCGISYVTTFSSTTWKGAHLTTTKSTKPPLSISTVVVIQTVEPDKGFPYDLRPARVDKLALNAANSVFGTKLVASNRSALHSLCRQGLSLVAVVSRTCRMTRRKKEKYLLDYGGKKALGRPETHSAYVRSLFDNPGEQRYSTVIFLNGPGGYDKTSLIHVILAEMVSCPHVALERLIVFEEVPMAHSYIFEILDRQLRDLMNRNEPFGGKIFLCSETSGSCKRTNGSCRGRLFRVFSLTKPHRTSSSVAYSDFLLVVRNGTVQTTTFGEGRESDTLIPLAEGIRVSLSLPSPKVVVRTVPIPTARKKSRVCNRTARPVRCRQREDAERTGDSNSNTHATAAAALPRTQKVLPTKWLVVVHKISELAVEDLEDIAMRHRGLDKHDESFGSDQFCALGPFGFVPNTRAIAEIVLEHAVCCGSPGIFPAAMPELATASAT